MNARIGGAGDDLSQTDEAQRPPSRPCKGYKYRALSALRFFGLPEVLCHNVNAS